MKNDMTQYFDIMKRMDARQQEVDGMKAQLTTIEGRIHQYMRVLQVEEMNVNNVRFSRTVVQPRKTNVVKNATILKGILEKHVDAGKTNDVLADIRKLETPVPDPAAATVEKFSRRILKR